MTKKELLEALTHAGVSRLEVFYDGTCDVGSFAELDCYGPDEGKISIHDELRDALECVLFDLLSAARCGWEIDEGSYGLVELDVATGAAKFSHAWRLTSNDDFEVRLREGE